MTSHSPSDLGQLTYLAYSEAVGGLTHDGRTMLAWEDLGETVQGGWIAAAAAVADHVVEDQPAAEPQQEGTR